jgi:hypothetical protein
MKEAEGLYDPSLSLAAGGFVEKMQGGERFAHRRAAEEAPTTAGHDVPRWARGQ